MYIHPLAVSRTARVHVFSTLQQQDYHIHCCGGENNAVYLIKGAKPRKRIPCPACSACTTLEILYCVYVYVFYIKYIYMCVCAMIAFWKGVCPYAPYTFIYTYTCVFTLTNSIYLFVCTVYREIHARICVRIKKLSENYPSFHYSILPSHQRPVHSECVSYIYICIYTERPAVW